MAQGDSITSTAGDDGKNLATGKKVEQRVTENNPGNIVNNYLDRNNPDSAERRHPITLDERLDRLEVESNERQRELTRLKELVDGKPENRFVGLLDQIAEGTKSDKEWKQTTEKWIATAEERIKKLEGNKQITISPSTAWLFIIIGVLALVSIFFILSWFQDAGRFAAMTPVFQAFVLLIFVGWYRGH